MHLDSHAIERERKRGRLTLEPFDPERLGPNSYDLSLGPTLFVYTDAILDARRPLSGRYLTIPNQGLTLMPGELYLGVTQERAGSQHYLPDIDGRSSIGRLGLFVHVTAGRGDRGFENHWTLELVPTKPVVVWPGMRVAQIYFSELRTSWWSRVKSRYAGKYRADDTRPIPSRLWQEYALSSDAARSASSSTEGQPTNQPTKVEDEALRA